MVIFLFIVGNILTYIITSYLLKNNHSYLEQISYSCSIWALSYLICSIPLITIDHFNVSLTLCILSCIEFILLFSIILIYRKKAASKYTPNIKETIIILLILAALIPFVYPKTEKVAADSDIGAYYLHTIILANSDYKTAKNPEEFGRFSNAVDEQLKDLQSLSGAFGESLDNNLYDLHGLGTWCCYTALFAKLFGLSKCMHALSYLYSLACINVFFLCKKIGKSNISGYIGLIAFCLSPLLLYISKAGLSELPFLFLWVTSMYFYSKNGSSNSILASICIGLVGFIHISFVMYFPIIFLLILTKSINQKSRKTICYALIVLVLFVISLIYNANTFGLYTTSQYNSLLRDYVSLNQFIAILSISCLSIAVCAFLLINKENAISRILLSLYSARQKLLIAMIILITVCTVYYAYNLCFTTNLSFPETENWGTWQLRNNYSGTGWTAVSYLNVTNFLRATGGLFIVFIVYPFRKKCLSDKLLNIFLLTAYSTVLYSTYKFDTPTNYYAARYLAPTVTTGIIICASSIISHKRIAFACFYFLLKFDNPLVWFSFLDGAPYVGEVNIVRDAIACIPEESTVFIDTTGNNEICKILTTNMRILNNNQVYNYQSIDEVMKSVDGLCYIVSPYELSKYHNLFSNIYNVQYSFGNGENGSYATGIGTYKLTMNIYQLSGDNKN